jgi:xanthine dehydrogenase YagS FAD-binding subunit
VLDVGCQVLHWRAEAAERALIGADANDALFAQAAKIALADAEPLAHNGYKLALAQMHIYRALNALAGTSAE